MGEDEAPVFDPHEALSDCVVEESEQWGVEVFDV
jgi:hypothetical protein